ncbi:MAG: glycosyltransferase [Magnetococcales bacterium]|nr:glycosyltransferase [Magnetococcales bacterium]
MHTLPPMGLSVVMMGRDEEGYLLQSLPPLLDVADEVVFVDTGSVDGTREIAADLGCRVFSRPWQDDFSAPKNFAVQQARYRWILNVDCDEVLQEPLAVKQWLGTLPDEEPPPAYLIQIDNLLADGSKLPMEALRFFLNDRRIVFCNPIHEGIADSLYLHWPNKALPTGQIKLLHYGYQAGVNQEKIARNVAILRRWVEGEPETIYGTFKLGINLVHQGLAEEGVTYLERAFFLLDKAKNKRSYPFAQQLVNEYYKALLQSGRKSRADEVKQRISTW